MPSQQVDPETGEILELTPKERFLLGLFETMDAKLDTLLARAGKQKRTTVVDDEFRTKMYMQYADALGEDIDHHIDLALAHKNAAKYTDIQRYVINWLKKAVENRQKNPVNSERNQEVDEDEMLEVKAYSAAMLKTKGERLSGMQKLALETWQAAHPNWTPENRGN